MICKEDGLTARWRAYGRRRSIGNEDRHGPGYRVYFVRRGKALVILVAGGDKRTQSHDIATAIKLARDL